MDALLKLVAVLLGFAFVIFLIGRSVKMIIVIGLALTAFFVLTALGLIGGS
jgi:hypothetical protein